MTEADIKDILLKAASKNEKGEPYISCKEAFEIASRYSLNMADVAKTVQKNNIKISKCQLGCF